MSPWLVPPISCALLAIVAYGLMRAHVATYFGYRRWEDFLVRPLLFLVVWPLVAMSPWLIVVALPSTLVVFQSSGVYSLYILVCHLAAVVPAYRYLYRTRLVDLVRAGVDLTSFWPGQVPAAMASAREQTPILVETGRGLDNDWRAEADRLISGLRLADHLPCCWESRLTIEGEVPDRTLIEDAHPNWRREATSSIGPLPPFPHLAPGTPCPDGIVRLTVECVQRPAHGMGRYYPYEGYFFSLLVQAASCEVFDARGEKAAG